MSDLQPQAGLKAYPEDMELTVKHGINRHGFSLGASQSYLPHSAEYMTFTITSVWSLILGIGRSSRATLCGPLKTTAFIVSFAIVVPLVLAAYFFDAMI